MTLCRTFARSLASLGMTRVLVALLLSALLTKIAVAEPSSVVKQTRNWRAQHEQEILEEFSDLLAIPNLASDAPNIQRNAEAIRALCEKRGLTTQLLKHEDAPPIVVGGSDRAGRKAHDRLLRPLRRATGRSRATGRAIRGNRSCAINAGNDVDWRKAKTIDPEWRLYARSAGDDKAPIIAMLAALDALQSAECKALP